MFTPFAFVKSAAAAAPPGYTGILDTYPGAYFGYSVRRLSGTYTGSCMQVKRSSDSSVLDVGFDSSGNLDTGSITTFVGGGNGFVNIWYDQSGNGLNATKQSFSTEGFYIVESGTLKTLNGKAAPYTPNGYTYGLGNYSVSITSNNIMFTTVGGCYNDTNGVNTYGRILSMQNSSNGDDYDNCNSMIQFYCRLSPFNSNVIPYQNNGYTTTGRPYTTGTQNLNFTYKDAGTLGGNTNGGSNTSTSNGCSTTNLNINQMRLGSNAKNIDSTLNGWEQEVILWPTYTPANQSGIVTNTNTYFATY
jgi:hypothetical protein